MPGQLLPCGNPFHSGWNGAHVLGTWVSQKIHKSLGVAEQEDRRNLSPPHTLIKQASELLRWWAGFSKSGWFSKTGEKGCAPGLVWPLCALRRSLHGLPGRFCSWCEVSRCQREIRIQSKTNTYHLSPAGFLILGWPKSSFSFFHKMLQMEKPKWTFWPT